MDGWMDPWIDEWMGGGMDGLIEGWMDDGSRDGCSLCPHTNGSTTPFLDTQPLTQPCQSHTKDIPNLPSPSPAAALALPSLPCWQPRSQRHLAKLYNCKQSVTALFVIIPPLKEQDELNELIKWLPVRAGAAVPRQVPHGAHAYGGCPGAPGHGNTQVAARGQLPPTHQPCVK